MLTTSLFVFLAAAPGLGLAAAIPVAAPVAVRGDASAVMPRQAQTTAPTTEELIKTTDHLQFDTPDEYFMSIRDARSPDYAMLDWSSDGCAPAKDHPYWWDFKAACMRRDFGARNFMSQNRLPANLARINDQFGRDLMTECKRHFWTGWLCKMKAARAYLKPVLEGHEPGMLVLPASIAGSSETSPEVMAAEKNATPVDAGVEDTPSQMSEVDDSSEDS